MSPHSKSPRRSIRLRRGDIVDADPRIFNGAWGCSAPCIDCRADLNRDGAVSGADMTILLANWGAECVCFGCPNPPGQSESQRASSEAEAASDALGEALAILGFDSVSALVERLEAADEEDVESLTAFIRIYMEARR